MTKSLYEMMNGGFTTVMKQHFVDYFVGKALNTDFWTTTNSTGSAGTWAMTNYGLQCTSGTGSSQNEISFNGIKQYDGRGCAMITIAAAEYDMGHRHGFVGDHTVNDIPEHIYIMPGFEGWSSDKGTPNDDHMQVQDTSVGSPTYTTLKLGVPSSLAFKTYKIEGKTASSEGSVNGILAGTITTTVIAANTKLQPMIRCKHGYTPPSVARKLWVKYCEAWNT
jgi:hypothetical protein